MLTAEQYRAKASDFANLLDDARSPAETRTFQELKQSYLALAENMEWMAANRDKTIEHRAEGPAAQPRERQRDSHAAPADRDNILRCLGAAVIMRWNTMPTKLQRELFEDASAIVDVRQIAPLREALARFLHDHKDDEQRSCGSI
jgi:hypothetical protein